MEVIAAAYTLFVLKGEDGSLQWSIDPSGSRVWPGVVVADSDGAGNLEIIYPSNDGRLHAFWLDKTEHGNWPYSIYNAAEGFYRFASEAVVAEPGQRRLP